MFTKTHTTFSPWILVVTNNKKQARLESIRYLLSKFEYEGKGRSGINILRDPNVVHRYHRTIK